MRTRYSFYNFLVSLLTSVLLPIFGMVKLRLFVDCYGSDVNGLQLTMMQVINFLNICALAYSLAFRQLLYKPLGEGDIERVKEIYAGAVKVFKFTGFAVIGLGMVIAALFPFFSESPLNAVQTSLVFFMLLLPQGLAYFFMGPNFVIIADQKEYKINVWIQTIAILRMILMILCILNKMSFFVVVLIEGANVVISCTVERYISLKSYPWLKEEPVNKSDTSFSMSAKYTIIQRLSNLATNNTDNIVISIFMGYQMTSVYGAYSYLMESVSRIINSAITAPINSFGNLFNDSNADSYSVFTEFFNFATYIASIISICIFSVMNQVVIYVMNKPEEFNVSLWVTFLFAINVFYLTMREPIIISRDANGYFKDAKTNAWIAAIVKVIASVVFIRFWGIAGVLLATLITNWVVDFLYNPPLVYRKVFHLNPLRYYKMVVVRMLIAFIVGVFSFGLWTKLQFLATTGIVNFLLACIILGVFVFVTITIIYAVSFSSFRKLFTRLKSILLKRKALAQTV